MKGGFVLKITQHKTSRTKINLKHKYPLVYTLILCPETLDWMEKE